MSPNFGPALVGKPFNFSLLVYFHSLVAQVFQISLVCCTIPR